jgi:hypothetical protein
MIVEQDMDKDRKSFSFNIPIFVIKKDEYSETPGDFKYAMFYGSPGRKVLFVI